MINEPKIFVALDFDTPDEAMDFGKRISPEKCGVKIGKELFTIGGPQIVEWFIKKKFKVFLDLKFHDIPNTVKKACYVASNLGVWMLNVHALGGNEMLMAAKEGVDKSNANPYLIAVTVLTSLDNKNLKDIGINISLDELILKLAKNAAEKKFDGIVCSANDIKKIKASLPDDFMFVTPGIRLTLDNQDDQKRIMTPELAIKEGSSILVIGRPITKSDDPSAAINEITARIS